MNIIKNTGLTVATILALGFMIPEEKVIPVKGATSSDWNKDTFWYEPWGTSGTHKGMDIFSDKNTPVIATTNLMILYKGNIQKGGNVIVALGPKWRVHYFAHLERHNPEAGFILSRGEELGYVGNTGNAQGKQPHLHYSIVSLLPRPWQIDTSTQGYKKAFFIDPVKYLQE